MTDEEAAALLRLALTSEPVQEYLKKRAEAGKANNPFGTKGELLTLAGVLRSAEGLSPQELSPRYDMAALPQQRATPALAAAITTPTKTVHPWVASYHFAGFIILSGGDTP